MKQAAASVSMLASDPPASIHDPASGAGADDPLQDATIRTTQTPTARFLSIAIS
jgi:hypothetical protein